METVNTPVIIPMWLTGFDRLMPEGRSAPWKFLPRSRVPLSVTFGKPIDADEIRESLGIIVRNKQTPDVLPSSHGGMSDPRRAQDETMSMEKARNSWLGETAIPEPGTMEELPGRDITERMASVRSAVTALLQRKVEELGREVMSQRARN